MRVRYLYVPVLTILTGCTTVRTVDFTGESSMYYRVTTVDGRGGYGRDLVRTPDSTTWTDAAGRRHALANAKVAAVGHLPQPAGSLHWSEGLAAVNRRARRRQARVTLADGTAYLADRLQMTRDATTWFDPATGAMYRITTASVADVGFRDGKRGTLRGLAIGMAAGALSGIVVGFASGDDPPDEWFAYTASEKALLGGLVLGVLGAPVGAILGSASKELFRFSRTARLGASPEVSPVTAPIVSPRPAADVPEAAQPAPRADRRPGRTWTVSAIGAGAVGGARRGLEDAMKASGFGKSSGCFLFCSRAETIAHPHSSGGGGWLLDVHRDVRPYGKVGFLLSRTGGEALGYNGRTYLFIRHSVTTYAPVFSLQVSPALRLGLGPALHRIATQQTSAAGGPARHQTRVGIVADLALAFPTYTRFYLELRAQYRRVGSVEIGPFEEQGSSPDSFFPASRVGFDHGFIGAGVGARF